MPSSPHGIATRSWLASLVLCLFACALLATWPGSTPAWSDDEPGEEPPVEADAAPGEDDVPDAPAPDTPAADDAPAPSDGEAGPRPEIHKLYVPYRELQRIFEKEGDGVFLPYAEFRKLWDKAHATPPDRTRPPVPYALRAASWRGEADGERLRLEGSVEIDALQSGWQRIPLTIAGLGVESALLDDKPALLLPRKDGYDLVVEGAGAHRLTLVLRGVAPVQGEAHAIAFSLPAVPLAKLELSVSGRDAEISLKPEVASTSAPGPDGRTTLTAWLGPVEKLELGWRRKPEEGPTETPLVFADEQHFVTVDRGVVRTTATIRLTVHRAPLARVRLTVPAEAVVVQVGGERLRGWTRTPDGTGIDVDLREPTRDPVDLVVAIERATAAPPVEVVAPWVAVDGVERERGFLRLEAAEGVRAEPLASEGLVAIDAKDLPASLGKGAQPGRTRAWRFPARPTAPRLSVTALEPRVVVTAGHRVALAPDGLEGLTRLQLEVDRAGIFGIDVPVPAGIDVTDVTANGAVLDDWDVRGEGDARRLVIAFRDRLLGRAVLDLHVRLVYEVPDEQGAGLAVNVPLLVPTGIEHARGYVVVHADPALDRRVLDKTGLVVLDEGVPGALEPPGFQGDRARLPLVHRFEHRDGPLALSIDLVRKAPTVTCAVDTFARLEPDRTRYGVTLRYAVAYRGVDTFRFSGPLAWGDRVHLEQPGMQLLGPETEPKPADAPEGWQATRGIWTVKLVAPRLGSVEVALQIDDEAQAALSSGESREVVLPRFVPLEVEGRPLPNVVHHVAVRRDPLLEVEARVVEGGEEIDTRELPPTLRAEDSFLAFRSYAPEHRFLLGVTRHDYEPVAEVVVSHMHLESVVPDEGRGITEAYLVVRSNDRQYLRLRLPGHAVVRAVRVGGQIEAPRVDPADEDVILVPLLTGLRKDEAFEVALVYEHDIDRGGGLSRSVHLASPEPLQVDADLLTWHVYLADDDPVMSFGGSVQAIDAPTSWAARTLARLGEGFVRRPQGKAIPWRGIVAGFQSPFATPKTSVRYAFQGRVGTGDVRITRMAPALLVVLKLLLVVLLVLVVILGGRALARAGQHVAPWYVGLLLVLFVALVPAGPGAASLLSSALLGAVFGGAVLLVAAFFRAGRGRSPAADASPPSDPEPPADEPPTDAVPAPEGGA